MRRSGIIAAVGALVLAFVGAAPAAPSDVATRIADARALEKSDVGALLTQFRELARAKPAAEELPAHLDFLAEYVVTEPARALRLAALHAGAHLDAKGLAQRLVQRADGEDTARTCYAIEGLGYVGAGTDVPRLLELGRSPSTAIGVEAVEAVARLGGKKDVDALIEIALDHTSPEVADHAAWAAQDLVGKQKALLPKLKKAAGKTRAARAGSIEAMLMDNKDAFTWRPNLDEAVELLAAAPATIEVRAADPAYEKLVRDSMQWLAENLPATELLVRAAAVRFEMPANPPDAHVDTQNLVVGIPLNYASQPPSKLAYHLARAGTVLFAKRIGEPFERHRGWENAIADSFDVCVAAKLYDAHTGAISREKFVSERLAQRPWGGN